VSPRVRDPSGAAADQQGHESVVQRVEVDLLLLRLVDKFE